MKWPIGARQPPLAGAITAPATASDKWIDVLKDVWPHLKGGTFLGEPVNSPGDVVRIATKYELIPQQVRDMVFAMPAWAPGAQGQQGPQLCQFTICFAGGRAGPDPARLLQERLRVDGAGIPATKLRNVHIYVGVDKTVAVAFKENSEHVVFEDETNLFPSDKLIAAFHLLLKAS